MSIQALDWVLRHSPATGSARLVLISIANHASWNEETGCWEAYHGKELIGHEAGIKREQTVKDALKKLIEMGQIERIINGAPDSRMRADKRTNLYRIIPVPRTETAPLETAEHGGTESVPPSAERGHGNRANGGSVSARAGARKPCPKPSVEPSVNQPPQPPHANGDGSTPAGGGSGGGEVDASRAAGRSSDSERRALIRAACKLIAERTVNVDRPDIIHPEAYLGKITSGLVAKHRPRAIQALDANPGLDADALADVLDPSSATRPAAEPDPAERPRLPDVADMPLVEWDPPPDGARDRIVGAARAALTNGTETHA